LVVAAEDVRWLEAQADSNSTFQVLAGPDPGHVGRWRERLGESAAAYRFLKDGAEGAALVWGSFATPGEAEQARERLPAKLRKEAWMRKFGAIRKRRLD